MEQCQADRFTALNATPSDLELVEQVINQAIFMFLDKHFKENKDKESLYGAICSLQPLIQLNIFVASQRAYCDLPGLHRRMLYPFKVTPGCIPGFHPEEDHGKKLQLSHHPSLGSLCLGMLLQPRPKTCRKNILLLRKSRCFSFGSSFMLDMAQHLRGQCRHSLRGHTLLSPLKGAWGEVYSKKILPALSYLPSTPYFSNNWDVLALPDKNWSLK